MKTKYAVGLILLLVASLYSIPTSAQVSEVCPSGCMLDVVLVLDTSGSMDNDSPRTPGYTLLDELKNASKTFINMTCTDGQWAIGLVEFNSDASVLSPLVIIDNITDKNNLNSLIDTLTAGGLTNIGDGISTAINLLKGFRPLSSDAIIVISDGLWNTGPDPASVVDTAHLNGILVVGIYIGDPAGTGDEDMAEWADIFINASDPTANLTDIFIELHTDLCGFSLPRVGPVGGDSVIAVAQANYHLLLLGAILLSGGLYLAYRKRQ